VHKDEINQEQTGEDVVNKMKQKVAHSEDEVVYSVTLEHRRR